MTEPFGSLHSALFSAFYYYCPEVTERTSLPCRLKRRGISWRITAPEVSASCRHRRRRPTHPRARLHGIRLMPLPMRLRRRHLPNQGRKSLPSYMGQNVGVCITVVTLSRWVVPPAPGVVPAWAPPIAAVSPRPRRRGHLVNPWDYREVPLYQEEEVPAGTHPCLAFISPWI